jgi:hypothetical protein
MARSVGRREDAAQHGAGCALRFKQVKCDDDVTRDWHCIAGGAHADAASSGFRSGCSYSVYFVEKLRDNSTPFNVC